MLTKIDFNAVEKIHPAFSGLLVDWSIGSREITSTLINLLLRKNIFIINEKVILNNLNCKYSFENKILKTIFKDKKELTYHELSKRAYNLKYREILSIISNALVTEGYIVKDVKKIIIKHAKDKFYSFLKNKSYYFNNNQLYVNNIRTELDYDYINKINLKKFKINYGLLKIINKICIVGLIISGLFLIIPFASFFKFVISIIFSPLLFFSLTGFILTSYFLRIKQFFNINIEEVLTEKGKKARNLSLELYNYIKKYPHVEDRLANELVSYSIAFGIGKNWMNKLGIGNVQINNFFEKYSDSTEITSSFFDLNKFFLELKNEKNK
jgi:hypothetical protein